MSDMTPREALEAAARLIEDDGAFTIDPDGYRVELAEPEPINAKRAANVIRAFASGLPDDTVTLPRSVVEDLAEYMESWSDPRNKNSTPEGAEFVTKLRIDFARRLRAALKRLEASNDKA